MPEMDRTVQSDSYRLSRVILKHARDAFVDHASVEMQWQDLNYLSAPDFHRACRESDALAALLQRLDVEVLWMPSEDVGLDSLYVRDASVVCDRGAILCSMGKAARRSEPAALGAAYERLGFPVLGAIGGDGRLEGGDVTWLGPRTLAVGRGYRTNDEGIRQLTHLLGDSVDEVVEVPLPHWNGPTDVFHLMSVISPLADDLAVVYSPLLPVPFRESLLRRGIELVEVPDEEFDSMGCNVLAVAPRVAVAVEGNLETRRRMEAAGVTVHAYSGEEISAKGCGGPTCLTRPLERCNP
jgi:N-dimethylarginine dimethylaminohydrolase